MVQDGHAVVRALLRQGYQQALHLRAQFPTVNQREREERERREREGRERERERGGGGVKEVKEEDRNGVGHLLFVSRLLINTWLSL